MIVRPQYSRSCLESVITIYRETANGDRAILQQKDRSSLRLGLLKALKQPGIRC